MAKLRAPQTRHCILQILAEVKDILHGPFPLRLRVCGGSHAEQKVMKHLLSHIKLTTYKLSFYCAMCVFVF